MSKVHRSVGSPARIELEEFDAGNVEHLARINATNLEITDIEAKFCTEQLSSFSRWLTSSLLVINSGALLAILNGDEAGGKTYAIILFLCGVVSALLGGAALQEIYGRQGQLSRQQWLLFKKFEAGFELDRVGLGGFKATEKKLDWLRWAAPAFGYLSGLLFVIGAVVIFFT